MVLAEATSRNTVDVDLDRYFGPAEIPFLADYGLATVPGGSGSDMSWQPDWFEWRDKVLDVRDGIWEDCSRSLIAQAEQKVLAYACPHYFKAIFGWIGEPRPRKGEHAHKPFVPFHYQVHLTNMRLALIAEEDERDMWFPKARGLGVSWNNQHDEVWMWLSRDCRWILSSRNEDLVSDIDNVDAMFGKCFYIMRRLPTFLLPVGFDPENPRKWWNSTKMLLTNKDKTSPGFGAQLVGSPTTKKVGRAGRYTGADVDEAQAVPKLVSVISSLRGSTFHIMLTGTEGTEEGEEWVDGWTGAKALNPANVIELNYHQNAYQDKYWLDRQYARAGTDAEKAKIALEYERNYFAGYGDWIYPEAHGIAETDEPYDRQRICATIFDPGKDDETAVLVAQPTEVAGNTGYHVLFTYEAKLTNMEWLCHVFTGIWPQRGLDSCFGMHPTPEEREIGKFYYQRWLDGDEMFWGMDPAGINSQSNASFWSMFEEKTGELRQRRVQEMVKESERRKLLGEPIKPQPFPEAWGVTLQYLALRGHRIHADRHYAMRRFIHNVTTQRGVLSARRNTTCLMRYQYNPRSPKAVTEAVPLHNQYSHLASCNEYLALYIIYGFCDPAPGERKRQIAPVGPGMRKPPQALVEARRGRQPLPPPDRGRRIPPGWRRS